MAAALELVAACDAALGIGRGGALPWRLPADLAHFRALTRTTTRPGAQNAVIMGRRTWLSTPPRFRPLPGRLNAVLTRAEAEALPLPEGVLRARSLEQLLGVLDAHGEALERIFIGGGAGVYAEALAHPRLGALHLTRVAGTFDCDTFFPLDPAAAPERFECVSRSATMREGTLEFVFEIWQPR